MSHLATLFPIINIVFSKSGISQSEATRMKESNRNDVKPLLEKYEYSDDKIYSINQRILSSAGIKEELKQNNSLIKLSDYDNLEKIGVAHAQSAVLGSGLILKNTISKEINSIYNNELSIKLGIEIPALYNAPKPLKKNSTVCSLEKYCEEKSVESLFSLASAELLNKISDLYFKALELEAQAAVYGKAVANPNSLLRKLGLAKTVLKTDTITSTEFILEKEWLLKVNPEEFKKTDADIMEKYTSFQKETNSYIKRIKDFAREMQDEYNAIYLNELKLYNLEYQKKEAEFVQWENEMQLIKNQMQAELSKLKLRQK
jgi:hypothetical protein